MTQPTPAPRRHLTLAPDTAPGDQAGDDADHDQADGGTVDQVGDVAAGLALDGAALLGDVAAAIARYVILPSTHALIAVVLWIAATHAVPAWNCAPRLVIRAPEKRCGKSRLLDLVEALCHKALITTNASPSAVYRSIGMSPKDPPALLIDEADTIFGKAAGDNEDLRGLLNAGHGRGRPALRYDAGSRSVERIETFAMAALAGIGAMPDTIEDRAVIIRMRRRAPDEHVMPYRVRRDGPALAELRDTLHLWVRAHLDHLTDATPTMPVEDRAADTWEPLVAIADQAGDHWPRTARDAVLALTTDHQSAADVSLRVRLLMDIRDVFGPAQALPSHTIVERLRADDEAPWADLAGAGLNPRRLSNMLREYDITPTNRRWEDGTQTKGYTRDDFTDAWARYCPEPAPDPQGTPLPSQPSQPSQPWSERDGKNPWDGSSVPAVLAVPGLTCNGTAGTARDGTPPTTSTCPACGEPLTTPGLLTRCQTNHTGGNR